MIIVHFHSEQEGNGRRLEQLGYAKVLKLGKAPFEMITGTENYGGGLNCRFSEDTI